MSVSELASPQKCLDSNNISNNSIGRRHVSRNKWKSSFNIADNSDNRSEEQNELKAEDSVESLKELIEDDNKRKDPMRKRLNSLRKVT